MEPPASVSTLDSALLWGATTIVWDRCDVDDRADRQTSPLERPDGCLAARAGSLNEDIHLAQTVLHRLLRGRVCRQACRVWRALAGAFEAGCARAAPAERIAILVGDCDDRIVEAGLDVGFADRHVLALAPAGPRSPSALSQSSSSSSCETSA